LNSSKPHPPCSNKFTGEDKEQAKEQCAQQNHGQYARVSYGKKFD
jgi:hypothetical protein